VARKAKRAVRAAVAVTVASGIFATVASGAEPSAFSQLAGVAGCLMQIGYDVDHGCARVGGLQQAQSVTLSPDDKFVYVASGGSLAGGSNGVAIFARDLQTGALTTAGCVTAGGGDGRVGSEQTCVRGDALLGAADVAISPDGATAYVASAVSGGLAWLARDTATGALTPAGCIKDFRRADRCGGAPGLIGAATVAVSPDGVDVYVGSPRTASIHALRRDAAGTLVPVGCVSETGSDGACTPAAGLQAVRDLAVAPDGRAVYAAGGSGAVVAFVRDPATGGLSETACLLDSPPVPGPCQDAGGIAGAAGVAVSPDGRDVYVASPISEALSSFRVQPGGTLSQTGCLQRVPADREDGLPPDKRCVAAAALWEPRVVTIAGDGNTVFAGGGDTITSYRRDPATGTLTQLGCAEELQSSESCLQSRATLGVNALAASRDGRNVYVTADDENAVTILGAAVTVVSSALRADRHGRVRVLLRCPAARANACTGQLRAARGEATRFSLRPGARARVRVTLGRQAARTLRRRASTRAVVTASDRALRPTQRTLLVSLSAG
jgi:6-phosphogluconolactonase (cycloisomerase 2 family)